MQMDNTFDSEFKSLKDLNWLPWVGKRYFDKRVLLVAESHYEDGDGWLIYNDATRKFVINQGLNSDNLNFKKRRLFQQIEKTLLEKETSSLDERQKIWNRVSFFNLVQRLLPSLNDRPTDNDYDLSWRNFLQVVDILRPNVCIKFGYEGIGRLGFLLNNSDTGWIRDNIQEFYKKNYINPLLPYCINLTKDSYKLKIIFTYHPTGSRGFYSDEWARHIRKNYPNIITLIDNTTANSGD